MCFIIKVTEKLLDKNKFACSKIIISWIHYIWMYNGKPFFFQKNHAYNKSLNPLHPHPKK